MGDGGSIRFSRAYLYAVLGMWTAAAVALALAFMARVTHEPGMDREFYLTADLFAALFLGAGGLFFLIVGATIYVAQRISKLFTRQPDAISPP